MAPFLLSLFSFPLLFAACGDDGEASADELAERAYEAVRREEMVYHSKGDDGSEVWLDVDAQQFRAVRKEGEALLPAIGSGWTVITYDALENEVVEEDRQPQGEIRPRIDDPVSLWFEPLTALSFGSELENIGETTSDGRRVIAVEARTPVVGEDNQPTGAFLIGRVELDPESYLVVAFERRLELLPGQTPDPQSVQEQRGQETTRIRYTTSEFIARAELAADFFARKHVEESIVTPEESLERIRELGLSPLWLGEFYDNERGMLVLQEDDEGIVVNTESGQASFHYALLVNGAPTLEAVVVKLGPAPHGQPTVPAYAGTLPEFNSEATVRGGASTVYTSVLTPEAIPCPTGTDCPSTDAPLYHRVQFQAESTYVQVETFARVDAGGADQNGYNNREGIILLAEALSPAPATLQ